eukprot:TRINITY_DN25651_c0_g1_i2.p1 TRINITY_DN25651_c0_g1~~TRINITY_DN25651_c0_g1_i2.p1  ORF type:complete len:343 (-),score=92.36 TRINITY_DN25651_c0_g1_i2:74-1102(-)
MDPLAADPYAVLGLVRGSALLSQRVVESAFRKRALRCHPDRHPGDPLAKARFHRLSVAKESLLKQLRQKGAAADGCSSKRSASTQTSRSSAPPHSARGAAATAAAQARAEAAAEKTARRRRAADDLLRREREAEARKKARSAAARATARRDAAQRRAEAEAAERVEAWERERSEIFDAWRQRKKQKLSRHHGGVNVANTREHAAASQMPKSAAVNPAHRRRFVAPMEVFAASRDPLLRLPGPFKEAEMAVVAATAAALQLTVVREGRDVIVKHQAAESAAAEERGMMSDGEESLWEPTEGAAAVDRKKELRRNAARPAGDSGEHGATPVRPSQREVLPHLFY